MSKLTPIGAVQSLRHERGNLLLEVIFALGILTLSAATLATLGRTTRAVRMELNAQLQVNDSFSFIQLSPSWAIASALEPLTMGQATALTVNVGDHSLVFSCDRNYKPVPDFDFVRCSIDSPGRPNSRLNITKWLER